MTNKLYDKVKKVIHILFNIFVIEIEKKRTIRVKYKGFNIIEIEKKKGIIFSTRYDD